VEFRLAYLNFEMGALKGGKQWRIPHINRAGKQAVLRTDGDVMLVVNPQKGGGDGAAVVKRAENALYIRRLHFMLLDDKAGEGGHSSGGVFHLVLDALVNTQAFKLQFA